MTNPQTFRVSVNGRVTQSITVPVGFYHIAVMACLSLVTEDDFYEGSIIPIHVKIWVPHLLPEYGPYNYIIGYTEEGIYSCWGVGTTPYEESFEIVQKEYIDRD